MGSGRFWLETGLETTSQGLRKMVTNEQDLKALKKCADWKVNLAPTLQQEHAASYVWLAKAPDMGTVGGLRNRLWHARRPKFRRKKQGLRIAH